MPPSAKELEGFLSDDEDNVPEQQTNPEQHSPAAEQEPEAIRLYSLKTNDFEPMVDNDTYNPWYSLNKGTYLGR